MVNPKHFDRAAFQMLHLNRFKLLLLAGRNIFLKMDSRFVFNELF